MNFYIFGCCCKICYWKLGYLERSILLWGFVETLLIKFCHLHKCQVKSILHHCTLLHCLFFKKRLHSCVLGTYQAVALFDCLTWNPYKTCWIGNEKKLRKSWKLILSWKISLGVVDIRRRLTEQWLCPTALVSTATGSYRWHFWPAGKGKVQELSSWPVASLPFPRVGLLGGPCVMLGWPTCVHRLMLPTCLVSCHADKERIGKCVTILDLYQEMFLFSISNSKLTIQRPHGNRNSISVFMYNLKMCLQTYISEGKVNKLNFRNCLH